MSLNNIIDDKLRKFEKAHKAFEKMQEMERNNLVRYAQSEKAKQGYINKVNTQLSICNRFENSVFELLDEIFEYKQIYGCNEQESQSGKVRLLEQENMKLKKWLYTLGKNPELVQFMTLKDFSL